LFKYFKILNIICIKKKWLGFFLGYLKDSLNVLKL